MQCPLVRQGFSSLSFSSSSLDLDSYRLSLFLLLYLLMAGKPLMLGVGEEFLILIWSSWAIDDLVDDLIGCRIIKFLLMKNWDDHIVLHLMKNLNDILVVLIINNVSHLRWFFSWLSSSSSRGTSLPGLLVCQFFWVVLLFSLHHII